MPGSNANSSSRGKKTFPTFRTCPVGSAQLHVVVLHFLVRSACVLPRACRGDRTGGTQCGCCPDVFAPLSARTLLDYHPGVWLPVASCAYAPHLRSGHTSLWDWLAPLFDPVRISTLFSRQACSSIFGPLFPSSSRWHHLITSLSLDYSSCKNPWRTLRDAHIPNLHTLFLLSHVSR